MWPGRTNAPPRKKTSVSFTDTSVPYFVLELQATLDEFTAAVLALN
jgi:hypothetical protein